MLTPIRLDGPEPVAKRVFRELRSAIVMMVFQPGQALSEKEIADQFGVSRQPIREAFIKLSEAGLLSIRPQRGTYVVKISTRQVYDVRFVREAVEVAVVRKAALELPAADIDALRATIDAQRAVADD